MFVCECLCLCANVSVQSACVCWSIRIALVGKCSLAPLMLVVLPRSVYLVDCHAESQAYRKLAATKSKAILAVFAAQVNAWYVNNLLAPLLVSKEFASQVIVADPRNGETCSIDQSLRKVEIAKQHDWTSLLEPNAVLGHAIWPLLVQQLLGPLHRIFCSING